MPKRLRRALLSLILASLAACGTRHPYGIPEQFGDSKPARWQGNVPSNYAVHGVDVSRFQGNVDWPKAASSGVHFAFIKATEGAEVFDPQFSANWQGTAAAGLPRGAYHFYYFCRTGAEQAQWFIQNVPREAGALPPVLDIEWTRSPSCPVRPGPEVVRAEAADFLARLTDHYGKRPIIYTSVDFFNGNQLWQLGGYEFWLRSVAGHPDQIFGGQQFTFWQYSGTGLAQGFHGPVDLNAFAGNESDWSTWLATHRL